MTDQSTSRGGRRARRAVPVDPLVAPLGALAAMGVAFALTPFRETSFGNTNAALILVVVIAATASLGGRAAGVIAAVTAALSYNFFLTQPYRSLHIDDTTDVVTVILLVVVGFVVGEFARNRFRGVVQLRRTTTSSHRLEKVAEVLASGAEAQELIDTVAEEIRKELEAVDVTWSEGTGRGELPVVERSGWVAGSMHHHRADGFEMPPGAALPVAFGGRQLGVMVVVATPDVGVSSDQRRVAIALTDMLATALVRVMEA